MKRTSNKATDPPNSDGASIPLASPSLPAYAARPARRNRGCRRQCWNTEEACMRIQEESHPLGYHAPNAILERMRRRIARAGLLVPFVSALLMALLIFAVCAYKSMH